MASPGLLARRPRRPAKMAAGKPWHVPMLPGFRRRCGLSAAAQDVIITLAAAARARLSCWVGNAAIAEASGLCPDDVKKGVRELVAKGWIVRWCEQGRRGRGTRRHGFVLLNRPDVEIDPVAERTEAGIAAAFEAMTRRREATARGRRLVGAGGLSATPN